MMNIIFKNLHEIKQYKAIKIKKRNNVKNYSFKNTYIYIIIPFSIVLYTFLVIYILRLKNSSNNEIIKFGEDYKIDDNINEDTYHMIVQKFIDLNANGTLIYDSKQFKKSKNPKISIVITVHNGEPFIKNSVRSAQNQDLHDIEILLIEDMSEDNSLKIIKELMMEDPRITLLENDNNKGI